MRRATIMRLGQLTIVTVQLNGGKYLLAGRETRGIMREVNRLLGLRRCSNCGRWIRPQEASYIDILNNRVVKVICSNCINETLNVLINIKC